MNNNNWKGYCDKFDYSGIKRCDQQCKSCITANQSTLAIKSVNQIRDINETIKLISDLNEISDS